MSDIISRVINKESVGTQVSTTVLTTTFPCTLSAVKYSIGVFNNAAASSRVFRWALVFVADGNSANTISFVDAADFYTPEQHIIAFGSANLSETGGDGAPTAHWNRSLSTRVNMRTGDLILFLCAAESGTDLFVDGTVQLLCKTK